MKLKFNKLNSDVETPVYAHANDAGADIKMCKDIVIKHGKNMIPLGFTCIIPAGYAAFLSLRSSWMGEGLVSNFVPIDPDYSGEWHLIVYNVGDDISIKKGEKICQVLVVPIQQCEFISIEEYDTTCRHSNGIGSTGK